MQPFCPSPPVGLAFYSLGLSLAGAGLASRGNLGGVKTAWAAFGALTALHVVCCAAGLKILRLRRLGCARRFYLAVDGVEVNGRAPTPAELAALDRVIGTPPVHKSSFAALLTPSTRRLFDGVEVPVPH